MGVEAEILKIIFFKLILQNNDLGYCCKIVQVDATEPH